MQAQSGQFDKSLRTFFFIKRFSIACNELLDAGETRLECGLHL
jgi:hypothetical protein